MNAHDRWIASAIVEASQSVTHESDHRLGWGKLERELLATGTIRKATDSSQYWRHAISAVLVASVLFMSVLTVSSPTFQAWASEHSVIGQYFQQRAEVNRPEWLWVNELGYSQEVEVSAEDQGIVLTVHRVIADPIRTLLFYSTTAADAPTAVGMARSSDFELRLNGQLLDGIYAASSRNIDGVTIHAIEFGPLPESEGLFSLVATRVGTVSGNWAVTFDIQQNQMTRLTRTVALDHEVELPTGVLRINGLLLSPVLTQLSIEYAGTRDQPDLFSNIQTESGISLERRRGSQSGVSTRELTTAEYLQRFGPVPLDSDMVTIQLGGLVYHPGEVNISLEEGPTINLASGGTLSLEWIDDESMRIEYRNSFEAANHSSVLAPMIFQHSGWYVIDDLGDRYPIDRSHSLLKWSIPDGRQPVAIVMPGVYKLIEDLITLDVELPKISVAD